MKNLILLIGVFLHLFSGYSQKTNFRENFDILNYSINLNITDFQSKTISGNTVLQISPNNPEAKTIILELLNMEIDSIFMFKEKTDAYSYNGKIIEIPFQPELSDGKCCTELTIWYHGIPKMDDRWGGFFFSDSTAYNMGVGMGSDPVSFGRVWFPCIDSFTEKATFEFNITVPLGFKAICSGILISITENENKTTTFKWKMKHEIPPYLVSVAVGKYVMIEDIYNGISKEIPVQIYVSPENVSYAKYSFTNLEKALQSFENRYGEYIWDRVGYVEVPFSSGAMEHACNIAYPDYAIDSSLTYETLMAHELSHSWFGNLVTCELPEDMWFNEGLTTFSEAVFIEDVYGKKAYKDYVRDNHAKVLSMTHLYDRGYRALYGVPHDYTYGSTVYDKGADVSHTLRWYMGDSIFFDSLKQLFKEKKFRTVSTVEFRDFLTRVSGIDLISFFENWVYTEGFPHFSIYQYNTEKTAIGYRIDLNVKQNLKERNFYGINNLIDITFVDNDLNFHNKRITMSGTDESYSFTLPFKPLNVFLDLEERISDAAIDNYSILTDTGSYDFPYTDFSILMKSIKGKALVQAIINFVKPNLSAQSNYTFSQEKYWEIRGCATGSFTAEGTFYLSMSENNLNADFEDALLFYRPDNISDFKPVKMTKIPHNHDEGVIIIKKMEFGQYIIGIKN
jgi:aminopeptidase N